MIAFEWQMVYKSQMVIKTRYRLVTISNLTNVSQYIERQVTKIEEYTKTFDGEQYF